MTAREEFVYLDIKFDFQEALKQLLGGKCDALSGPRGGIVVLDKKKAVVFNQPLPEINGILFSAYDFLGEWTLLRKRTDIYERFPLNEI